MISILPPKRWCDDCKALRRSGDCEHKLVVLPECVASWACALVTEDRDLGKMTAITLGKVKYDSDWSRCLDEIRQEEKRGGSCISDEDLLRMAGAGDPAKRTTLAPRREPGVPASVAAGVSASTDPAKRV